MMWSQVLSGICLFVCLFGGNEGRLIQPPPQDKTEIVLEIHPGPYKQSKVNNKAGSLSSTGRVTQTSQSQKSESLADFSYNILSQFGPFNIKKGGASTSRKKETPSSSSSNQKARNTIAVNSNSIVMFRPPPSLQRPRSSPAVKTIRIPVQTKPAVTTTQQTSEEKNQNRRQRGQMQPGTNGGEQNGESTTPNIYDGMIDDDYLYLYNYFYNDVAGGASGPTSMEVTTRTQRPTVNRPVQNQQSQISKPAATSSSEQCECMFWCPTGFEFRGTCHSNYSWMFGVPMSRCCLSRSNLGLARRGAAKNRGMIWDD